MNVPPPAGPPPPPPPIRAKPVILGLFLGSAGWILLFLGLVSYELSAESSTFNYELIWAVFGVVGMALLLFTRTRQAGAGLLLGLAVSSIVWSGLCLVSMGLPTLRQY